MTNLYITSTISNIVSKETMYWLPLLVIFIVGVFSLMIATYVNRKTDILTKVPSTIWAFLPTFLPFIMLLIPMVFLNVDILVILLVVGCVFVCLAAFAFINIKTRFNKRYFDKKQEKFEKIADEKQTTFK